MAESVALSASGEAARHARDWAAVLGLVIRLHDREADADLLATLRTADLTPMLEALLAPAQATAATGFAAVLAAMPDAPDAAYFDQLAADYADIYLTHGYRVSPSGSVWLTDDHLERQQPMFDVRAWYEHYGIRVPDWRLRSDDHLVHELQFVEHLLGLGTTAALGDAAHFLDRHVLSWVPDFCNRAETRAQSDFHRAAMGLTRASLAALRDWLTTATGVRSEVEPHAFARERDRAARAAEVKEVARPFVPGIKASW